MAEGPFYFFGMAEHSVRDTQFTAITVTLCVLQLPLTMNNLAQPYKTLSNFVQSHTPLFNLIKTRTSVYKQEQPCVTATTIYNNHIHQYNPE